MSTRLQHIEKKLYSLIIPTSSISCFCFSAEGVDWNKIIFYWVFFSFLDYNQHTHQLNSHCRTEHFKSLLWNFPTCGSHWNQTCCINHRLSTTWPQYSAEVNQFCLSRKALSAISCHASSSAAPTIIPLQEQPSSPILCLWTKSGGLIKAIFWNRTEVH